MPVITQHPGNAAVTAGQTASFTVTATGPNLSAIWSRARGMAQPEVLTGAVPMPNGISTHTTPVTAAADDGWAYGAHVCSNRGVAGVERCVNSNAGVLSVAPVIVAPVFTTQPASVTAIAGQTASLTAVATGQPAPTIGWSRLVTSGPFTVLEPICSLTTGTGTSTSATCTTAPLTLADNGMRIQAGASNGPNGANTVSSAIATITVLPQPVAPSITTPAEPSDRTVATGGSVSWTVGASGTAPLSYTWRTIAPIGGVVNDGGVCDQSVPAGSRNAATLTLANVPFACNGYRFQLVVRNGTAPDAFSRQALLTVTPASAAPTITSGLVDRSVPDGTQVTFSVVATGTPATFSYAWTLDGAAVPEVASGCTSTSASCTFTARLAQTGKTVRVTVSNGTAPDAASSATLTVTTSDVAASITQQPVSASTVEGGSAGFTIGVAGTPTPSVQWQTSTDGVNWSNAGTGTTLTITGATLAQSGLRVRALVSNTIATATGPQRVTVPSSEVTLSVTAAPAGMVLYAGDFSGGGSIDGVGTQARLDVPEGLAADASGNLYVAQTNGDRVARIAPGAVVSTIYNAAVDGRVPGSSNVGSVALGPNGDLYAAAVSYCALYRVAAPASATPSVTVMNPVGCAGSTVRGLAVDDQGRAYLALIDSHTVFRVANTPTNTPTGPVYDTNPFVGPANPYLLGGAFDANGSAARFNAPRGMAFAPNGDLFVADSENHTIRRVTPQADVTTFAGTAGQRGTVDGTGAAARFNTPVALAFDAAGNLYVLEIGGPAPTNVVAWVRRISPAGEVTTLFNATSEAQALATPAQAGFAANIKGMAVLGSNRIALTAGNAIVVRTLP
jgi:sugar lactone lactonase YvrE